MQKVIQKLEELRDSMEEGKFNLINFLVSVQEIDEGNEYLGIYNKFGCIVETDELKYIPFNVDLINLNNNIEENKFFDLETLEKITYNIIVGRINFIIEELSNT